jgi:hypothetical protein
MKISASKYILFSSVIAIFSEAIYFKLFIDCKLFYLIIIINFYLLNRLKKITFDKNFILFYLFLFFHGVCAYLFYSIPIKSLLSQLIGIGVLATYYYNFVAYYNKSILFKTYSDVALIVALIGYPLLFFGFTNDGIRFQSVFTEPAHYAIVVIPACYYFYKEKKTFQFMILFGSLIFSQSSIGYIGCLLMICLPLINRRRIVVFLCLLPFLILISILVFQKNPRVNLRVTQTYESLKSIKTGKFEYQTNESTYALLSNMFVAKENFLDHPLGTGLGSYHHMYTEKYYTKMRPPQYLVTLNHDKINSQDAASLFLRFLSDLGVFGLFFMLLFILITIKLFNLNNLYIEQGIAIYIILKLIRDGHYFPPEFYFFIFIFYKSIKDKINYNYNEKYLSYNRKHIP